MLYAAIDIHKQAFQAAPAVRPTPRVLARGQPARAARGSLRAGRDRAHPRSVPRAPPEEPLEVRAHVLARLRRPKPVLDDHCLVVGLDRLDVAHRDEQ
jgi:hypothetical protein